MAVHEMTVVRYYMRRGAYIAAAKRAEQIVAEYPGSPITVEALGALEKAYSNIGLKDQAADAHKLRQAYLDPSSVPAAPDAVPAASVAPAKEVAPPPALPPSAPLPEPAPDRSEEHTSDLQSLMRISYAVFC